jgi:hypothetical protein
MPSAQAKWNDRFLHKETEGTVEALSLWVAGSYARGAPDCGDLDLILEYKVLNGADPGGAKAGRALLKRFPDVRVYCGTPEENTSGVNFEEAILVWRGRGFRSEEAIASVKEDVTAKRFARPTDQIPFRSEQLFADIERLKEIVALEKAGIIRWTFRPLTDLEPVTVLAGEDENELVRISQFRCGEKTRKLIPYIVAYFRQPERWPKPLLRHGLENNVGRVGGARILVGRPYIPTDELDKVTTSELVLIPHITSRGPNGIWTIHRGENHPLVSMSRAIGAFTIEDDPGEPAIVSLVSDPAWFGCPSHTHAKALDIFKNKKAAAQWARELNKDEQFKVDVAEISGKRLLDLLSNLDVLLTENGEIALTHLGVVSTEAERISTSDEVLQLLKKKSRQS